MPRTQDRVALKKSQSFKKIIEEFFGKMDVHLFAIGQLTLRSRSLQVFALIAPANAELSSAEGGLLPAVKREHLKPRGFERNRFLYSQGTAWESGSRNRRNTCRPRVLMVAATNLREYRASFQPLGIVKAGTSSFSSRRLTCHRSACLEHRSM